MSKKVKTQITCPFCKTVQNITVWDSVNVDLNPEQKERIFNGEFFNHECINCGKIVRVLHTCLYHDMTHNVMMFLVDKASEKNAVEMFSKSGITSNLSTEGYKLRITTSPDIWREKAIIFEHGFDDRIIEIIKLIYETQAIHQYPKREAKQCLFSLSENEGEYLIYIFYENGITATAPVTQDFYNRVEKDFIDMINKNHNSDLYIDKNWAIRFWRKANQ